MKDSDLNNNFTTCLSEITIIKDGTPFVEFKIHPWEYKGNPPMESLVFTESINSTNIGGSLYIKDIYNWSEELNLHSFSKIIVKFIDKVPTEEIPTKMNSLEFNVISVSQVTNRPMTAMTNDTQTLTIIRIDFTSEDIFSKNLDENFFPEGNDFVGFIASENNSQIPGLVNKIFQKLNITNYEIEPTYNGIWIKSNEITYPWAKNKGQISLSNLMQYICNYAVCKTNPNAVNYFFWRDKEGFKFKSIEKLLSEQEDSEYEKISFSDDFSIPNQIRNISQMHEPNILQLAKNNIFQTYYEKITPNYEDYYLDFVDTALSFKKEIVDLDYNRDHVLWKKVESYKLIPDTQNTNVYFDNSPIQNLKTDDLIYGYYDNRRLNNPFPQKWDHIGKTMDSRWNDVSFIPQYDMTDLEIDTFYTIHKKIREPLREKRKTYSYLKNLNRKWEVYRCSVCCLSDRIGGIQDEIDINSFRGLQNPTENSDFIALFGATGIFGDTNIDYKIVAAGSFSDVYNFDSSVKQNRGLTLSYDLNSAPYNETIQDFYHFKEEFSEYEKFVLDGGLKIYDMHIEKNNQILSIINTWLQNVDFYITKANDFFTSSVYEDPNPCSPCRPDISNISISYTPDVNYLNTNENCFARRSVEIVETNETSAFINPALIPWLFDCSAQKYISNTIYKTIFECENPGCCVPYQNYGENLFNSENMRDFNYEYYTTKTEGLNFDSVSDAERANEHKERQISSVEARKSYAPMCLNPITLQITKKIATKQKVLLEQENILLNHIKDRVKEQFVEKWKIAKENYFKRKAFFISKKEQKIDKNQENIKQAKLSLWNIKSIKRNSIRGSRYEVLATKNGITGQNIGPYLYKIFFNDEEADIGITGNHPYYDQTYTNKIQNSHISLPKPKKVKKIDDLITTNNPENTEGWSFGPKISDIQFNSKLSGYVEMDDDNSSTDLQDLGYSNTIIRKLNKKYGVENYENRYNLYNDDLVDKKPPNLKKEEISSYVRIEFNNPIGIDSIIDFPDGFIRNAGYEYFLPYLVSLTSGPNGRQTIKQNVVVIGMDPYGFDVAMKRIPDVLQEGEYYWWSNNLDVGQMDLWPEVAFETKYTYYTQHDPNIQYFTSYNELYGLNTVLEPNNSQFFTTDINYVNYDVFNTVNTSFSTTEVNNYGNEAVEPNDTLKSAHPNNINYTNSAKYDDLLKETKNASKYLFNSHKVLKAHRNWWSFHIPENIIIIPKFESISKISKIVFDSMGFNLDYNLDYSLDINENIKFSVNSDVFQPVTYAYYNYSVARDASSYLGGSLNGEKLYNHNYYKNILRLKENENVSEIIDVFSNENMNFFYEEHHSHPLLSPYKDFEITNPDLKTYFEDITNYWMQGDHITYKPSLITDDVWKYDLSGYSEYGLSSPPVRHNHGDIFDSNFAAQFVVFARTTDNLCKKNNLKCVNPNGPVYSQGCPESDPYCNCPAQNRKPTEPEPSYLELYKLEQEIKECSLIQEHLGSEWLGCVWSNPDNTGSCNCPEIGERFMDYMAYNRTYATFWSTPPKTPLFRSTQFNTLFSQTLQVEIPRNDNIKIGSVVYADDPSEVSPIGLKRFGGKWIVTEITNIFYANKDFMSVTMNRDSFNRNINQSKEPETVK